MKTLILFSLLNWFQPNPSTELTKEKVQYFSYDHVSNQIVASLDYEQVLNKNDNEEINLIFTIDERQTIQLLEVESNSALVSNYAITQLNKRKLNLDQFTANMPYSLTIKYARE